MELILAFILAWVCTLSGVALGGFLVFRTKREGYEQMFSVKPPEGQAFNTDDGFGDFFKPDKAKTELPKSVMDASDRFTAQFAETLANKAGEK